MVRAFQKRAREAAAHELEGERETAKRRILELEAEAKLAKSLGETQADEVAQAHAAELGALQRRVGDLEEEKAAVKRSYDARLGEEKALRIQRDILSRLGAEGDGDEPPAEPPPQPPPSS